jgi:hypothetical protein
MHCAVCCGSLSSQSHSVSPHLKKLKNYIPVFTLTWVVQWLKLTLSEGPNRVDVFPPHMRTETDAISKMLCSIVF